MSVPLSAELRGVARRGVDSDALADTNRALLPADRYSGFKKVDHAKAGDRVTPAPGPWSGGEAVASRYPSEIAKFTSWLIRQGYIREVTLLLPSRWRAMPEEELTTYLSTRFTEAQLAAKFKGLAAERVAYKTMARRGAMLTAFLIGVLWARENVAHDEWGKAIAKIAGTSISAVLINKALYARDKVAAQIMGRNAGRFGKWFQGVARTNRFLNRLLDVGMISIAGTVGLSGGGEYPSIPFDIIYDCDIDDPATWRPPNQRLLDYGFNIWYRQKATEAYPQANGGNIYLGTVYGSVVPIVYGLIKDAFLPGEAY